MEIPMDCKPCPQGGYCPGQQACECHSDTLRAKLNRIKAIAERQLTDDPPISDLIALTRILTEIQGE